MFGYLTDSSGETLPGGTVFLPEIQRGAATDLDGGFMIADVPAGTYDVEVSSVGYRSRVLYDVVVAGRPVLLTVAVEDGVIMDIIRGCCASCCCYERPIVSTDPFAVALTDGNAFENRPDRYGQVPVSSLMSTYWR